MGDTAQVANRPTVDFYVIGSLTLILFGLIITHLYAARTDDLYQRCLRTVTDTPSHTEHVTVSFHYSSVKR